MATNRTDNVRRYGIRRVNPFLGVVQVIESAAGRATSANGVTWLMEPLVAVHDAWGSLNGGNEQEAYVRYGLWSEQEGLVKFRSGMRVDQECAQHQAELLIDPVREHLDQLPFPLEDRCELWLFEQDDSRPIALLASIMPGAQRPMPPPKYWSAGLGPEGTPGQFRYPDAGELERQLRERAGFNLKRHWIERQEDGSGVMENSAEPLPAENFPPFLLTESWPEAGQAELARGFIRWTAPALLTLQRLGREQRQRLESCLGLQSLSIEHHWRLYPECIDQSRLNAARVQCRLQKANRETGSLS